MSERSSADHAALSDREELFLLFVNTNTGGQPEQLTDAAGLAGWVERAGLSELVGEISDADAASAREIRDALQTLLLSHSDRANSDAEAVARAELFLARLAPRYPLVSVVSARGARLEPAQTGVPALFALILASVIEIVQSGAWTRFKACQNPICHWGFVDRSRNKTAKFHASTCGAQVAMRAYRQRKKQ